MNSEISMQRYDDYETIDKAGFDEEPDILKSHIKL